MVRGVAACVLVLVLSGCSSSPDGPTAEPSPTSAFTTTADDELLPTVELTDTVHLLAAPHTAATLPIGLEEFATQVSTTSPFNAPRLPTTGNGTNTTWARWELPRPDHMDFVTGSGLFFVEFQGTTANAVPFDQCYWRISLVALQPTANTGVVSTGESQVCLPQSEALPSGIHELQVTFPGQPVPADAGDRLVLTITSSATMTPGSSIVVLSGTPEHDSRVTLNGLQVPLDLQTYL